MDSLIIELGNYSIVSSLNERSIYLKITDNIGFLQYESNLDSKEFRLNLELPDIFTIIKYSFMNHDDYTVNITHTTGTMKLQFHACVGGFLKINFDLFLKERIMSNDGQLTLTINKLEQKVSLLEKQLNQKNKVLQDLTNKLSYSTICIWNGSGSFYKLLCPFINVKELNLYCDCIEFDRIQYLYCLTYLKLGSFDFKDIQSSKLSSNSLTKLCICNHAHTNNHPFASIRGIENIPNLNRLELENCKTVSNIPTNLDSYTHKIISLDLLGCSNCNVVELQTYCQLKQIKLSIK